MILQLEASIPFTGWYDFYKSIGYARPIIHSHSRPPWMLPVSPTEQTLSKQWLNEFMYYIVSFAFTQGKMLDN